MASQTLQMPQTQQPHPGAKGDHQQVSEEQHEVSMLDSSPTYAGSGSAMKQYNMYYTLSRTNARLHIGSSTDPCLYYVHITVLTTKPQIFLRAGDSKSAPVVAFAKIHYTSRHIHVGTGDFEHDPEDKLTWEELHREQNILRRGDYSFSTSFGFDGRKKFQWRRDRKKYAKTVYDCVDEDGLVVAHMFSGGMLNFRKGGEIRVSENLDKKLEELLLVSATSIWVWEAGGSTMQGYGATST